VTAHVQKIEKKQDNFEFWGGWDDPNEWHAFSQVL
jgi:hypothetical protein